MKQSMDSVTRRELLGAVGGVSLFSLSGCLGSGVLGGEESDPDTHLKKPDRGYEYDPEEFSYPGYGQKLPEYTIKDPLKGEQITTTGFDTDLILTFIYSYCRTACPRLTSTLRNVQSHSIDNGYADEVSFAEITFNPERDTPERLREYADIMNINLDAGNWYFLRPESVERAKEIVTDGFGVVFNKTNPEGMERYMFQHLSLILLVNKKGYVERAYTRKAPRWQKVRDDLRKLRKRES